MTKKKNKKSIFKRILSFGGALFCAFAFCFGLVNINNNKETLQVSADSVVTYYTYSSSNLYIPIARSQATKSLDYLVLKMNITGSDTSTKMVFDCDMFYNNGWNGSVPDLSNYYYWQDINVLDKNMSGVNRTLYASNVQDYAYFYIHDGNYGWSYDFYYRTVGTFTGNVNHIRLDSFVDGGTGYNRVTFFSSDGHYLVMWFSVGKFTNNNGLLSQRDYYLNDPSNYSDNEQYQFGYSAGRTDGYNSGYSAGEKQGYSDGYNAGELFGYNNGYSQGSEDSNQYTFLNLVSSVIDAPMLYFSSLFNFELLGINLQGFLMALFTLCVIVTLVKLCLGG